MKYHSSLLFFTALLLSFGCTSKIAEGTFLIDGTVKNAGDNTNLYLIGGHGKVDTIGVTDGKFTFCDSLSAPVDERMLSVTYPLSRHDRNMVRLYLESGKLRLEIPDVDSLASARLTGSATQSEMDELNALTRPYYEPLVKLNDEFYKVRAAGDTARLAQVRKEISELSKQYNEIENKWVSEHPQSYYAFQSKSRNLSGLDFKSVDSLFNSFPEKLKGTSVYRSVEKELNSLKKCAPGAIASDFTDTDINGSEFTLSSLKGHYILLDFWASWCKPCRASMPHVLALYNKYKDKGLEVVCVADDDSSPDKWKTAVKEDGIMAFHHVLRGLKHLAEGGFDRSEDKDEDYAIHFIPTKYLIGPDFKIIGKFDDKELDAELVKVFGF